MHSSAQSAAFKLSPAGYGTGGGGGGGGSGSAVQQRLSRYLPSSRHGSILAMSRTRRAALQVVEENDIITIESMNDAAAHALLHKKLGDKVDRSNGIAELATALEHMPLALVQAAAYIRERAPRCSVRQYLAEFRESDSRKTSLLNQAAGHLWRDEGASKSILLTWQISFDHVRGSRRSAADLLSLMSFFDRHGIQEALLRHPSGTAAERESAVRTDDGFEDDVLALRDYSFITVTRDANMFQMHSLVQLATRTWLDNEKQLDKWRKQFISNLCAELPTRKHEDREKCQALFPHARVALAQRPNEGESLKEWALLLYRAAEHAWQEDGADEAEQMSVMSMEARSEVFGEDNMETLRSMEMVGVARELSGKYKEAEAMDRQTLARREKLLGHEHLATLANIYSLAYLTHRHRYTESLALYDRASAGYQAVLGKDHPITRVCHQHHTEALASQEQGQLVISPMVADDRASVGTGKGKGSKLLRGLAKMGIKSSQLSAR
ncbi:hypothetical protein IAQ61_001554 [Plenodomus lingam]|uniref:uncharacterized protein n=1 Tax=Leptosphaeria maculans TaxID=5022 RepID=UPI0033166AA1|nr:hypothetical protein IAQ61_001554 [Plenodomus lingam]